MGTTLTGTTPQDTYDSLIKVTDNGPISGTAKYLSDGLGNDSVLALSTAAVGIGTASPTAGSKLTLSGTSSSAYIARIVQTNTTNSDSFGLFLAAGTDNSDSAFRVQNAAQNANLFTIQGAGNVGIGTSAPAVKLQIVNDSATTNEGVRVLTLSQSTSGTPAVGLGAGISFQSERPLDSGLLERAAIYGIASTDADTAGELAFYTRTDTSGVGVNEKMRLTSGGYMRMASGTFGIQFNGDTAAANALDDYEEGTWTIGVSFGGASVGVTYGANTATYTKIGRQVTVNGYLLLTNKGSSTGAAVITGLPFTIANNSANYSAPSMFFDSITFANQFQGFGIINTTTIALQEITILGVVSNLFDSDFANNSGVIVSLTYFV
jgi:hypothetical protein